MAAMLWIMLPLFVAAGSALLAFYIMQAKLEVAVAKERETIAETTAKLASQERLSEEKVRAAEESSTRKAFEQFLGDFRVEERSYMRENKSMFLSRKSLVLQERLFFRNIPLSNWVEHEMVVEEGSDLRNLAKSCSIFSGRSLSSEEVRNGAKLLKAQDHHKPAQIKSAQAS
jgi:hypothetical protein